VNDEDRLSERLQILGAAVSRAPSLLDEVMHRIGDSPESLPRRSRWKGMATACLATVACLVVSAVVWMTIGGDTTETASIDGSQHAVQPAKTDETNEKDATGGYDSDLFVDGAGNADPGGESSTRGGHQSRGRRGPEDLQEQRGFGADRLDRGEQGGESGGATARGASRSKPQLSDFTGLWRGKAVDKPEDGTVTDSLGVRLIISESGQLEGTAFDRFVGGAETPLQHVYVAGVRLEFEVRHRTGAQMRVTLGLADGQLKGDGIPIRSDESRCDILLKRQPSEAPPRRAKPSKS